ncbi:hypothetical protein HK096_003653 [Nowakowskiella sp. JEL0078]|nr:hypothetical protein HK096_003653 [Nowakowskiella sp. JEL0078]
MKKISNRVQSLSSKIDQNNSYVSKTEHLSTTQALQKTREELQNLRDILNEKSMDDKFAKAENLNEAEFDVWNTEFENDDTSSQNDDISSHNSNKSQAPSNILKKEIQSNKQKSSIRSSSKPRTKKIFTKPGPYAIPNVAPKWKKIENTSNIRNASKQRQIQIPQKFNSSNSRGTKSTSQQTNDTLSSQEFSRKKSSFASHDPQSGSTISEEEWSVEGVLSQETRRRNQLRDELFEDDQEKTRLTEHVSRGLAVVRNGIESNTEFNKGLTFLVGKSTGKSYSVTANLQQLFSLLRAHNPNLCSVCKSQKKQSAKKNVSQMTRRSNSRTRSRSYQNNSASLFNMIPPHASIGTLFATKKFHSENDESDSVQNEQEEEGNDIHAIFGDKITSAAEARQKGNMKMEGDKSSSGIENETIEQLVIALRLLEDELSNMKGKYNELIQEYMPDPLSSDQDNRPVDSKIGEKLKEIIKSMDIKTDQISILREIIHSSVARIQSISHEEELSSRGRKPQRNWATQIQMEQELTANKQKKQYQAYKAMSSSMHLSASMRTALSTHSSPQRKGNVQKQSSRSRSSHNEDSDEEFSKSRNSVKTHSRGSSRSKSPGRAKEMLALLRNSLKVKEALIEAMN